MRRTRLRNTSLLCTPLATSEMTNLEKVLGLRCMAKSP